MPLVATHPWGYLESSALDRGAWMRERLVLLPPGISDSERRAIEIHRYWPIVGACLALVVMIVLGGMLTPIPAFAAAFGAYAAGAFISSAATRQVRDESLTLAVLTVATRSGARVFGNVSTLNSARALLAELDAGAEAGELSASAYRLAWESLFWLLAENRTALHDELAKGLQAAER